MFLLGILMMKVEKGPNLDLCDANMKPEKATTSFELGRERNSSPEQTYSLFMPKSYAQAIQQKYRSESFSFFFKFFMVSFRRQIN